MARAARGARRQEILEALARELESCPGARITTARIAAVLGVSEAALYRHFPSKAKMFEALLEFAEHSVFTRSQRVLAEEGPPAPRVRAVVKLLLTFADRNPGITRVLLGEAVVGEKERVRERAAHFFERIETELRQLFRDATLLPERATRVPGSVAAGLVSSFIEGRMSRFNRSEFRHSPLESWEEHWEILESGLWTDAAR